jgi:RNA polymerase sigma-70 factor (ECF subfamily)
MLSSITTFSLSQSKFDAFRKGDEAVFGEVFRGYYQPLCHYAYLKLTDWILAEELAADAFVKLYQQREHIRDSCHLQGFLCTCTRNACIDYTRKRERYQRHLHAAASLEADAEPSVEQSIIRAETLNRLYKLAEHLPGSCNRIFELYFYQGYSTEQIACQLNMHPKTVLNQKGIGLRLLRNSYR